MDVFAIPVLAEMNSNGDCPKTVLQEVLEGGIDDHGFNFFRTKAFYEPLRNNEPSLTAITRNALDLTIAETLLQLYMHVLKLRPLSPG
jgi:hypothetical protein